VAKKKQKHLGFHKWNKWGKVWVYEGDHCLAVGSKKTGYSVFASKQGINIDKTGKVTYKDASGFSGTYETRGKAKGLVDELDKTMSGKGLSVIKLSGGPEDIEAFSQVRSKTGGSVVVYQEGDTEGRVHEKCHYISGHLRKGAKKISLKKEKEAVGCTIRSLRFEGKYTSKIRKSIIKNLATYCKGKTEKTRLKKAEKFVKEVEG